MVVDLHNETTRHSTRFCLGVSIKFERDFKGYPIQFPYFSPEEINAQNG